MSTGFFRDSRREPARGLQSIRAMPRVLVTYATAQDRPLAARTAMALVHRGVDVDVTPEEAVRRVPAREYRYVVPAVEANLTRVLRLPRAPRDGAMRIVGHADSPAPSETGRLLAALLVISMLALLLAQA